MTEENELTLGLTKEELKENLLASLIMGTISFTTIFLGFVVRKYIEGKIK